MLHRISWAQYTLVILLLLIGYYYWWLKKYAPSLGWNWLRAKPQAQPADPRLAHLYPKPDAEAPKGDAAEAKPAIKETNPEEQPDNHL
jgi:hypothetical protein